MFSKKICASNSSLKVTRIRRAVIQDYKNLDKSLFLLPGLSFSPWLSIYRWIVSTGAIFKDFFCSLWHLIVQHLSAIFHNQNQTKTLNENYYLNSLCTLIAYFDRPISKSILFFFYYNIFIVSEQVFSWFFMNLSRHAVTVHTSSNAISYPWSA